MITVWRITGNTDNCLIMPDYCLKTTAGSSKLFSQCLLYERQTLWDSSAFSKSKTLLSHHFGSRTILSCTECTWWWMCIHGSRHACMPACFPSTYCQLWSFEFRSSQLNDVFCQIIAKCCQLTQNMKMFFHLHILYVLFYTYTYSFPIQNQPPRQPTNFLPGKLWKPPCMNARQPKSSIPRSNKQINFALYGQWTYIWRPHKRTNTI